MDYRISMAWALGLGLAVAGAYADEPSEKKSDSNPVTAHPSDKGADSDVPQLFERLERLSAQLGQLVDEGREDEARSIALQCRELLSTLKNRLRKQNGNRDAVSRLPQALDAIQQAAQDSESSPVDGKLVKDQDLQNATANELRARLRAVQIKDAEHKEHANEATDDEAELIEVVVDNGDGERAPVWVVQTPKKRGRRANNVEEDREKPGNDEEARFEESKRKLEAARDQERKLDLDRFAKSISEKVQAVQRLDNPAEKIERLRDIAGAIRGRAADVAEHDAERAFDMLRNAERIESQAKEIAERFGNERMRAALQRGERDQPPMGPPGMMGRPPGTPPPGMANVPDDPRGKAIMAQRLLMAAGLKKEAGLVGEAIEREFAVDPTVVKRLRAELEDTHYLNKQLKARIDELEKALREQRQTKAKAEADQDREKDDEEGDDEDDEEEDEE
jgi:hypothetical protein